MPKGTAHVHSKHVVSIAQALGDGTANGAAIDCRGFEEALVQVDMGLFGGTSPTLDVTVEESPDGTTGWVAITGAVFAQQVVGGPGTELVGRINLINRKRFLRAVETISGTGPTGEAIVSFNLVAAREVPVTPVVAESFNLDT